MKSGRRLNRYKSLSHRFRRSCLSDPAGSLEFGRVFCYDLSMNTPLIGVDIGGTKTEATLVDLPDPSDFSSHRVIERKRIPTDRNHGIEAYIDSLRKLIGDLIAPHSLEFKDLKGIGIGLPGAVHPGLHRMVQGSIPFFKDQDLSHHFRKSFGFDGPMIFENDANCFALAEASFGAGALWAKANGVPASELCLLGVTLGTGVGGGMVVKGDLIRGRRGGAGEIGHMSLGECDHACYCGKFGCAEQFLSGPAFELSYRARTGAAPGVPARQIFELARKKDPFAVSTLEAYKDHLVRFLSNLSNLLDPHVIVLGGGLSLEDEIFEGVEARLSEGCFLTADPPAVLRHRLGDSGGSIGAAYLSLKEGTTRS
ncbi:MAG: ROK family protein [Proteobacteria bacterium]|nr:ROK family protein [Pseudomonadota bacterium]